MSTTTCHPARAPKSNESTLLFSTAAAALLKQLQADTRSLLLADLSIKDNVVILLEHTNTKIEFDDLHGSYYLHANSSYAICLYRGRPDATSKYPNRDSVWWGHESRTDALGITWDRHIRGLVCNDFGDLVQVAA